MFDEQNLVSSAGLVPVLELAEQTGLSELIGEHVDLASTRVKSGAVNPAGKLTSIIAGIMCGADSIDDANVLRAGGTPRVFNEVYAPSTLGIFLREFTFGHANQLAAVARAHLVALAARVPLLPGAEERVFIDIDSLLRPVYGHQKQGASFGHAKIASRALLRLGLSPQITTISTAQAPPVIAEARLRSGRAGSGRAAASRSSRPSAPPAPAGTPAPSWCAATRVRHQEGDQHLRGRSRRVFPVGEPHQAPHRRDRGHRRGRLHPGALPRRGDRPDTGALISDAEVAETPYTLRLGRGRTLTVRLVVRRVKDARYPDGLFPVWRYHPFVTNSELPVAEADLTHRRHAIIETTFADLIDGPLAHIPSGLFAANCAWLGCAVIAHNLLRAAGTLAGGHHAVARGATLRRDLVNVPARFAAPARKPTLHLPAHWPWQNGWKTLWDNVISYHYPTAQPRAA